MSNTKKKILLATYEYPPLGGGTGKAAMNTALWLTRMGFDVAVLTSAFENLPREERTNGFTVFRIPVLRRHLNYANALDVLSFAASGLFHHSRITNNFAPDLVLAYHTVPSAIIAWRIASALGIPFVTLLRGQDVPGYPEVSLWMHRLAWPLTDSLWKRSSRVIANSEGLAALAHESSPALRIDVVHNGIDLDLYKPAEKSSRAESAITRVIYTGRLIRKKRVRELVEAWGILNPEFKGKAELLIAGFGPEREKLESLAADLHVADSVRFLGRLDEPGVIAALRSADIFVNPSEGEGLPNAVLEAMASGLAVVLSDIEPHRELLSRGEAGLLCGDARPNQIADALKSLLYSAERRRAMGSEARRIVEKEFSWEQATRKLVQLLPAEFQISVPTKI